MSSFSQITLNKSALEHNVRFIRSEIGPEAEFVSVVKGNAYGHGIHSFVPLLSEIGVRSFAVFNSDEANEIIATGVPFDRLMIMGAVLDEDLHWIIEKGIECFVFTQNRLLRGIEVAKKLGKSFRVHVEIETGMNRTGYDETKWLEVCDILHAHRDHLIVEGICTHLAGAEEISNYVRIQQQLEKFEAAKKLFEEKHIRPKSAHIACSAGVINYPETIGNLARVGILQYGFWPSKEAKMGWLAKNKTTQDPLVRVIEWSSYVMSIKEVGANEYVGYGLSFLTETPMRIATVPVGYSNGYSRALSNRGKVLVRGKRVDVIGIVNMNLLMMDVTNIPEIEEGDEVVLIGNQGDQEISVASFSDFSSLLNYQLLTRLPERISRTIK
ncbi:MAG: alanine racemase [bacterium]|nr:alanine racemase [bacterium]